MADMNMYVGNTWLAYTLCGCKSTEMTFGELGLGYSQLVRGSPFLAQGFSAVFDAT